MKSDEIEKAYNMFAYSARSKRNPQFPMITELLYEACGRDGDKFHMVEQWGRAAFEAGVRAASKENEK